MTLFHEIPIFETVKSKVIISLFETVKLSVSISPRNLYNSLKSIKEKSMIHCICPLPMRLNHGLITEANMKLQKLSFIASLH